MELGSINLVVKDPDKALNTYLKLFGTNNIQYIIGLKGLSDSIETVDGYHLKTTPVSLNIFTPRDSTGKMGKYLKKYSEGIYNIELHLGQDEFEKTYNRLKNEGFHVSDKLVYTGKFSEAMFWLEVEGDQGVPVKYATKTYHGMGMWQETVYLDTPQEFKRIEISEAYPMPRVNLGTIMVTVKEWEKQQKLWESILSRPGRDAGNLSTMESGEVDDGRGNIFIPVKYRFPGTGAVNLYCALNENAPINLELEKRGKKLMYHNICAYVTRDRVHDYWNQLEENGFAMVDPKPMLNDNTGNGNYFFFVHPISTHGVLCEIVSAYTMDEGGGAVYDWSDTETYMVSPDIQ
jgi:hypothetical protein